MLEIPPENKATNARYHEAKATSGVFRTHRVGFQPHFPADSLKIREGGGMPRATQTERGFPSG